jgi:inhibitor of cysteine peptidase
MKYLYLMLLLLTTELFAAKDNTITLTPNQSSFTISLPANATTGYQWSVVTYDQQLFTLENSQYQKPNSNLIGAGSTMMFTFSINPNTKHPKTSKIVLKYARPWGKEGRTSKEITVNFSSSATSS